MSETLYRDIILDHSRNPRNAGRLESCTHQGRAANPLCGDELEVTVRIGEDRISDIRAAVRGCVISQAAASLMTLAVTGQPTAVALALGRGFNAAMEGATDALAPELSPLQPLLELRKHRSRIGCALLAWVALERALTRGPGGPTP